MERRMEIRLRTLTPIWTGGVGRTSDRLHESGLIGSLRWWYEAVVRGLGGYACDPTGDDRCTYDADKGLSSICHACQLFGCTGWARKFRLRVLADENALQQADLKSGAEFTLQFLELRPLDQAEQWLLAKSIEVAAQYGSIGGKTTLKPQKHEKRGADYGIVSIVSLPSLACTREQVEAYLQARKERQWKTILPDLRWFFFVQGQFLGRELINHLIGLRPNGLPIERPSEAQLFLRGRRGGGPTQPAVSKKLFSFKVESGRVWGYARDRAMRERIEAELGKGGYTVKTGEEVLREL